MKIFGNFNLFQNKLSYMLVEHTSMKLQRKIHNNIFKITITSIPTKRKQTQQKCVHFLPCECFSQSIQPSLSSWMLVTRLSSLVKTLLVVITSGKTYIDVNKQCISLHKIATQIFFIHLQMPYITWTRRKLKCTNFWRWKPINVLWMLFYIRGNMW
jgi:hypothetical protein